MAALWGCELSAWQESPGPAVSDQPVARIASLTAGGIVWGSQDFANRPVHPSTRSEEDRLPLAGPADNAPQPPVRLAGNPGNRQSGVSQSAGTGQFQLAAQPPHGARFDHSPNQVDGCATVIDPPLDDFSPTPVDSCLPYDAGTERWVYEGKNLYANRRPLLELGRPWYQLGQLKPASTVLGSHNLVSPQLLVYGDYRMAYASNDFGDDTTSQVAFELNLNFDLRLTATERFTAFVAPLDKNGVNTRWLLDERRFVDELDFDIDFGMFEGDLGALAGGLVEQTLPFDLPFALGVMPLLLQNGVWMEDAVLGLAMTIPARHSRLLDISNMDTTFIAAFDNIDSPAFEGDRAAAKMYGFASFLEATGGYWEVDYAFLEDRDPTRRRSYHNISMAFSRRYGRFISNSMRVIFNTGQTPVGGAQTADGSLVLLENSLITSRPHTFVPYLNLFAGFDRPQSAARAAGAGGVLRNTGILFETDGMTGYPTLDATGNDTWGGALGLNILTTNFDQQLILELAALQTMGNAAGRNAVADQYGAGVRYQIPLSNAWILRADGMYGFFRDVPDTHGARMELRYKF